jgi:hypothetical protein
VIEDKTEMTIFYANENGLFTEFTIQLMEEGMKTVEQKNDGFWTFCKNILNAAYRKDWMNKSKYSKLVVMDKDKAFMAQCFPNFKEARHLNEDKYIVEKNYRYYTVDTALQEAVFKFDNAKFWYIKFVYDFMYKCIDMRKVHFIEGDIDSLYYAISGDRGKDCHQGFEHVIKDG